MRSPVAFLTLAAAFVGGVFSQTINTPSNLEQCQPSLITWTGTTGNVQLFITSGDAPSGPTTHDLGTQSGTSFTYTVTEPANTRLVFNIRTSTGAIFQTGIVTVTSGGNAGCLTSSSGSASASGSTTSAATSAGTTTTAATTTATTTAATGTTTATSPTTSATRTTSRTTSSGSTSAGSAAASSTGNSAPRQYSVGVAGVVGAAVIALLA